jgi:hypothetical protein
MAELAPHDLTSVYSHATYYVTASSFFATLPPWKAFDNSTNYWIGTGGGVDWLQLDLGIGASATLSSYTIQVNVVPEPNRAPKNFTMKGSNDGTTWTTVDTQTNQTSWTSGEIRTFTLGRYVCGLSVLSLRYHGEQRRCDLHAGSRTPPNRHAGYSASIRLRASRSDQQQQPFAYRHIGNELLFYARCVSRL